MRADRGAATVPCPDCGSPVRPDVEQLCPRCGYPLMFLRTVPDDDDGVRPVARAPGERDDATAVDSRTAPMRTVPAGPVPGQRSAPPSGAQFDCPRCGYRNDATRIRCERCGNELREARPVAVPLLPPPGPVRPPRRIWPIVAAALAVVVVLALTAVLVARGRGGADPPTGPGADPAVALEEIDPATIEASASSTIPEEGRYEVTNTLDGDLQTVWNSDGKRLDTNVGVELTFRFAEPVELARITVVNGSAKSAASFRDNQRIARMQVHTDAGSTAWTLTDSPEPQSLTLEPATTESVTFVVEETYDGERWPDLALTEVSFDRRL